MSYKSNTLTTVTRDLTKIDTKTGNLYETIVIIAKRANQISAEMKEEINGKLAEFTTSADNLEEIFENREQIEISKYYERLPKPTLIALQEYQEAKIYSRNPAREGDSASGNSRF